MFKDIDWVKAALLAGMGVCILLLMRQWDEFSTENKPGTPLVGAESSVSSPDYAQESNVPFSEPLNRTEEETPFSAPAPDLSRQPAVPTNSQIEAAAVSNQIIHIRTDVLDLQVDLNGGTFVQADLIDFHERLDNEVPFRILNRSNTHTYVAKSGLLVNNGDAYKPADPLYSATSTDYRLEDGQDELVIELTSELDGYSVVKQLTLRRGDYLIDVDHRISNQSDKVWQGAFFAQIDRDDMRPPNNSGFGMKPYVGAALTTPDDRYKKIDFEDMEEERYSQSVEMGWVALLQHYFVSAWIPNPDQSLSYELGKYKSRDLYFLGFTQPAFDIQPGETTVHSAGFYVGPKDQYRLEKIAEHLDLTVDYGFLWWAAQPLFWLLQAIQGFVVNWGLAIILLTCVVKLVFYPLSAASYRSMARMRKLTPKMQALKERYGDDRQTLSQETMKLYQKEKVNPLGGCLPMLLQMPVFMALYWVLMEAVELRHAPLIWWIQDLSAKDPWYLLPIVMGISMVVQQRLNPAPPDPMQAKVMQIMPIMFAVMMAFFPSGLVLYWTANNLLSITQQWIITRRIEASS